PSVFRFELVLDREAPDLIDKALVAAVQEPLRRQVWQLGDRNIFGAGAVKAGRKKAPAVYAGALDTRFPVKGSVAPRERLADHGSADLSSSSTEGRGHYSHKEISGRMPWEIDLSGYMLPYTVPSFTTMNSPELAFTLRRDSSSEEEIVRKRLRLCGGAAGFPRPARDKKQVTRSPQEN